jgi:hypothetical protein
MADWRTRFLEFGDEAERYARGVLGPAYGPVRGLVTLGGLLSPASGAEEALAGSRQAAQGVQALDPAQAIGGSAGMAAGILGMVPIAGTAVRGARAAGRAADDVYRAGLSELEQKAAQSAATGRYAPGTETTERFYTQGASYEDLLERARRGEHLNPKRGGGIIGAPMEFSSPADIERARRASDQYVATGAPYRYWYDEGAQAIRDYGGTPQRQELLASGMGLMSPNTSPTGATANTIAMHNAAALQNELASRGLTQHAGRYLAQYDAPVSAGQATGRGGEAFVTRPITSAPPEAYGSKTGPYTRSLMLGGAAEPRTVNDLWRGRAQEYTGSGVGTFNPAQHNYMWGEGVLASDRANALQMAGVGDWTPSRVQAAEWVGKRFEALKTERDARIEKINASKASDAEKQRQLRLEMDDDELLAAANEPIRETLERTATNVAYEAIPGAGLGHFESLITAPADVRAAYSAPRLQAFVDPTTGQDLPYSALEMFARPARPATGEFIAPGSTVVENNPAQVVGPLFSTSGQSAGHAMAPFETEAMEGVEKARALLLGQHGVGTTRFYPVSRRAAEDAATGVRYEGTDVQGAIEKLKAAGLDALDVGGNYVLAGRFEGDLTPKQIMAAAQRSGLEGLEPGVFRSSYIAPERAGPGTATADVLRSLPAGLVDRLDTAFGPIAERLRILDATERGLGSPSEALQTLRAMVGKDGFAALKRETRGMTQGQMTRYLAARGLPAVAGAALIGEAARED